MLILQKKVYLVNFIVFWRIIDVEIVFHTKNYKTLNLPIWVVYTLFLLCYFVTDRDNKKLKHDNNDK